jgi:hypothetical protein
MSVRLQITPFQSFSSSFSSSSDGSLSSCGFGLFHFLGLLSLRSHGLIELLGKLRSNDSEASSSLIIELGVSDLGGIPDVSITASLRSNSDNSCVNGTRDGIVLLDVKLGQVELIFGISRVHLDVLPGRFINELLHTESLDSLVFWN